jgi:hypothetical protein
MSIRGAVAEVFWLWLVEKVEVPAIATIGQVTPVLHLARFLKLRRKKTRVFWTAEEIGVYTRLGGRLFSPTLKSQILCPSIVASRAPAPSL